MFSSGQRYRLRTIKDPERDDASRIPGRTRVHHVRQTPIMITDAPHLRVCLVLDNVQDGDTAPLNVKRPCAILMLTPCEVAPIVGVAFPRGGGISCAFGRGRCYQESFIGRNSTEDRAAQGNSDRQAAPQAARQRPAPRTHQRRSPAHPGRQKAQRRHPHPRVAGA
jgi:hypothetical protein